MCEMLLTRMTPVVQVIDEPESKNKKSPRVGPKYLKKEPERDLQARDRQRGSEGWRRRDIDRRCRRRPRWRRRTSCRSFSSLTWGRKASRSRTKGRFCESPIGVITVKGFRKAAKGQWETQNYSSRGLTNRKTEDTGLVSVLNKMIPTLDKEETRHKWKLISSTKLFEMEAHYRCGSNFQVIKISRILLEYCFNRTLSTKKATLAMMVQVT